MKKSLHKHLQSISSQNRPRPDATTKIARILACLLEGTSINRFEAESHGDHCLNSTISHLVNRHGLTIERHFESVRNRWGRPCLVKRYRLRVSEYDKARRLLAYLNTTARSLSEE